VPPARKRHSVRDRAAVLSCVVERGLHSEARGQRQAKRWSVPTFADGVAHAGTQVAKNGEWAATDTGHTMTLPDGNRALAATQRFREAIWSFSATSFHQTPLRAMHGADS